MQSKNGQREEEAKVMYIRMSHIQEKKLYDDGIKKHFLQINISTHNLPRQNLHNSYNVMLWKQIVYACYLVYLILLFPFVRNYCKLKCMHKLHISPPHSEEFVSTQSISMIHHTTALTLYALFCIITYNMKSDFLFPT